MQFWLRTALLPSFIFLVLLSVYIASPWMHAAYTWRQSTIKTLDIPRSPSIHSIPRIIHQTYRDNHSIPIQWQQASNSCRTLHSDYEYKLWTDEEGRRLIEKVFPCLLSTFDSYPYNIQRADVIRLVVLYVYGGIYIDFDIICLKSLDQLLQYQFILPRTTPVGLSNDLIISKPKHPFLLKVINDLPRSNRNYLTKYPTVMFSTGPMFLTHEASYYSDRESLDILSPELYGKYVHNSSHALFRHLKASSWHGNDASVIKWIYRKRYVLLLALLIFLMISFTVIYFIPKHIDIVDKTYSSVILDLNDTKSKTSTVKYRKFLQIILFYFLCLILFFFNRFE